MKFPILIIKNNESPLYYSDKDEFALVSKNGESFYLKGTLYDSHGDVFIMNGIKSISPAPFLKSLKYFQKMFVVEINFIVSEKIGLPEFKELLILHLNKHKKYWIKRDLIVHLEKSIFSKNSFEELIKFLK